MLGYNTARIPAIVLLLLCISGCPESGQGPSLSVESEDTTAVADVDSLQHESDAWDANAQPDLVLPDQGCAASCAGKACGDDGCGGMCGKCGMQDECIAGVCVMACDSPSCQLGWECALEAGTTGLCGGTIDFDHALDGANLPVNVNVESAYGAAGILMFTDNADSIVATNPYALESGSGNNSCASLEGVQEYWQDNIIVGFVVPRVGGAVPGATYFVSMYIGQTWNGGIAVDFYPPGNSPASPDAKPFHTVKTGGKSPQYVGTYLVQYQSQQPIGFVRVRKADDGDFTFDDFSFGSLGPANND